MATTLRKGSTDKDSVMELQEKLNQSGNYNLAVDGIFGKNTLAAVKDYQSKNKLAVDGIVGTNTWAALNSSNKATTTATNTNTNNNTGKNTGKDTGKGSNKPADTTATATPTTTTTAAPYSEFTYDPYTGTTYAKSETVLNAEAALNDYWANKPGAYQSVYQDEADAYLSQYQNRDPFSYDFNSDALYNQYKDQYIQQGQMAMMDTMGQAAAMTGGYGNSYAQTVGQQAYNQSLSQLNDIMPELYQMAYDRYDREGQELLNMYEIYMGKEQNEYNKYQDSLNNYYTGLNTALDTYNTLYNQDYNTWYNNETMNLDNYWKGVNADLSEWTTKTGIDTDLYKQQINNDFTASQNELDRVHEENLTNINNAWKDADREDSQTFTASQNAITQSANDKKTNYNNLVTLAAGGYEPDKDELAAAGMTKAQYDAIKKSSTTETKPKEQTASHEEIESVEKSISRCTTSDQLLAKANDLIGRGYSKDWVKGLIQAREAEINKSKTGAGGAFGTQVPTIK